MWRASEIKWMGIDYRIAGCYQRDRDNLELRGGTTKPDVRWAEAADGPKLIDTEPTSPIDLPQSKLPSED